MTTRDIHDQIEDLYGIQLSAEMVSKITVLFSGTPADMVQNAKTLTADCLRASC